MELKSEKFNTNTTLEFFNNKTFEMYKEWLDINLKLNKSSSISYFLHLNNFLKKHSSALGYHKYFYLEKLYYFTIELKLVSLSKEILNIFIQEFGRESKIIRMEAQLSEIENLSNAFTTYKKLISFNQEDRVSIKKFLAFIKPIYADNLKKYVELWNEYLKVYMDDFDAWYELSDVYLQNSNYNKAIYCLEEVLLHLPNNYEVYTKIGDILSTMNNSESAVNAIKYYSQSILIKPTPRAFWGLVYAINVIYKANKNLDEKTKNLLKISKANLMNFYKDSPIKITVEQFYDIKLE